MFRLDETKPVWVECQAVRAACTPGQMLAFWTQTFPQAACLCSGDDEGVSVFALPPERVLTLATDSPDSLAQLEQAAGCLRLMNPHEAPPLPFVGGWIGYIGYDIAFSLERLARRNVPHASLPLMHWGLHREVLCYAHATQTWSLCVLRDAANSTSAVQERFQAMRACLNSATAASPALPAGSLLQPGSLRSNFSRPMYERAVGRALEYIAAGDVYQVNLAQCFSGTLAGGADQLAPRLWRSSPSPFFAWIGDHARQIVSSSPERFLSLSGRTVETWPIKGTRPRGATPAEDRRLQGELWHSEKETAELTMITDLLRNDLGRVCVYGSVQVPQPRVLESFAQVHHTRSTVRGTLRPDCGIAALLQATLPGGSITGAPKVRAMEIIEELEPCARGVYCGCIGYLGVDGRMDLNIAIRTLVCEGREVSFHVGGGIVADSDPAMEYEETLHKAQGMLQALGEPDGAEFPLCVSE